MTKEYYRLWWEKNKHKYKSIRKEYEQRYVEMFPARRMFNTVKSRAKKQNILFNLEPSDIIVPEYCPILGVSLKRCSRYAPTVDRIDPDKGYTKGNVWVISKLANVMKNDADPEELRRFASWVKQTYQI